jgi:hypothetical protein
MFAMATGFLLHTGHHRARSFLGINLLFNYYGIKKCPEPNIKNGYIGYVSIEA